MCVSVGQLAAKLLAAKSGSLKKILPLSPSQIWVAQGWPITNLFQTANFDSTAYNFAASWPTTETHSTSL